LGCWGRRLPKLIFLPQGGVLGQSPKADAEARFKAKVLSQFVLYNELKHVVELEYGYSSVAYHQLTQFPAYRGFEANKHTVPPAPPCRLGALTGEPSQGPGCTHSRYGPERSSSSPTRPALRAAA
jgi:hypothetical protein